MQLRPVVENRVWQKEELLPRDELVRLQATRLRSIVEHVAQGFGVAPEIIGKLNRVAAHL